MTNSEFGAGLVNFSNAPHQATNLGADQKKKKFLQFVTYVLYIRTSRLENKLKMADTAGLHGV